MPSAFYQRFSDPRRASMRRVGVFLLVLLAHLLVVLLALVLPASPFHKPETELAAFQLLPDPRPSPKPSPRKHAVTKTKTKQTKGAAPKAPAPIHAPPSSKLDLLPIDLASSDISKMPSHHGETQPAGGTGGTESGDAGAAGTGPGGQKLYNAEWYVEPSQAQLDTYLPRGTTGWGLIACRTIEKYRVEDCQIIDESPMGSGIARGVVNAAWQFKVLPPRVGGHAMVGAWVRIRIDLTKIAAK